MRPIKFRAWDKVEKKWVQTRCVVFIRLDGTIYENEFQGFIDPSDRYEVMQFTGLLDAKGREIYEGDILDNGGGLGPLVVKFGEWDNGRSYDDHEDGFGWYLESPTTHEVFGLTYIDIHKTHPVVGNIYEHPGLLKEAK